MSPNAPDPRRTLLEIYQSALRAVDGRRCVAAALREAGLDGPAHAIALGKAAGAMLLGARDVLGARLQRALVVTKTGHLDPELARDPRLACLEAGHPWPDRRSLDAGAALVDFLDCAPAEAALLFLVSGGSSALVERLPPGLTLDDLIRVNDWLLGSGLDIRRMNQVRRAISLIKGGGLLPHLGARRALCLLISDVPGDDPAVIGSGPLCPSPAIPGIADGLPDWLRGMIARAQVGVTTAPRGVEHRIVASNSLALDAAQARAQAMGFAVFRHPALAGDALAAGRDIAAGLRAAPAGIHLWGGETTVTLPPQPGRGGRCQSLALAAACELAGQPDIHLLAAGTDGSDGPTSDAGALVDGQTRARGAAEGFDAENCLARADAGPFLAASGDLISTGPTGTNVMDLVIAHKSAAGS